MRAAGSQARAGPVSRRRRLALSCHFPGYLRNEQRLPVRQRFPHPARTSLPKCHHRHPRPRRRRRQREPQRSTVHHRSRARPPLPQRRASRACSLAPHYRPHRRCRPPRRVVAAQPTPTPATQRARTRRTLPHSRHCRSIARDARAAVAASSNLLRRTTWLA